MRSKINKKLQKNAFAGCSEHMQTNNSDTRPRWTSAVLGSLFQISKTGDEYDYWNDTDIQVLGLLELGG